MNVPSGWTDASIAGAYHMLEAIQDRLPKGSTEAGLIGECLSKLDLADTYVEKRIRESQS